MKIDPQIFDRAIGYVKRGWIVGCSARDANWQAVKATSSKACCWCMGGALIRAGINNEDFHELSSIHKATYGQVFTSFNDHCETTKEIVVERLQELKQLCEKEQC